MQCSICAHELPPLVCFLAQTETGTQCPNCWTILRRMSDTSQNQEREEEKGSLEAPRAAA